MNNWNFGRFSRLLLISLLLVTISFPSSSIDQSVYLYPSLSHTHSLDEFLAISQFLFYENRLQSAGFQLETNELAITTAITREKGSKSVCSHHFRQLFDLFTLKNETIHTIISAAYTVLRSINEMHSKTAHK